MRLTVLKNGDYNGFQWGENSAYYYYLMGTDFDSYFKPKQEIIDYYSTADIELTNERFFVKDEKNKLPYWKMLKRIMSIPKEAQNIVYQFQEGYFELLKDKKSAE